MDNPFRKKQWFTVCGAQEDPGHRERQSGGQAGSVPDGDGPSSGEKSLSDRESVPDQESVSGRENASDRESRRKGMVLMAVMLAVMLVILIVIGVQLMKVAGDAEALEAYLEGWGSWGVLVYMLLVILQILAAIVPGGPFEIAGGYLYGPLKGAIICDIAMTIGSVVVFMLSRKIGMKFVRMFFSKEEVESVRWLQMGGKKTMILFLIFLIPGTPKDLISYVVGLTDVPLRTWVFITAVGRFPAIYFSTLSGAALENQNYVMFVAVLAALALCTVIGALIYRLMNKKKTGGKTGKTEKS